MCNGQSLEILVNQCSTWKPFIQARLAAPPGMLLMRSEQHGLVLVQTNQAPGSAGLRGTANINQSTAIKVQQVTGVILFMSRGGQRCG